MQNITLQDGQLAQVDDAYSVSQMGRWRLKNSAVTCAGGGYLPVGASLPREVLNYRGSEAVWYRDGNPLNCTRQNLFTLPVPILAQMRRIGRSKPKYTGTQRAGKRWKAVLVVKNKRRFAGIFDTELEAALAYDALAARVLGDRAVLNFGFLT